MKIPVMSALRYVNIIIKKNASTDYIVKVCASREAAKAYLEKLKLKFEDFKESDYHIARWPIKYKV
jgi:hypothetical protein